MEQAKVRRGRTGPAGPAEPRLSLKQAAYEEIKRLIVTLKLRPGERINGQVVSEMIGIGITPVQQALQMLSAQGFVQILPRKGVLITPYSLEDALTVLEARIVVETELARFAAQRADNQAIARLETLLSGTRTALEADDFDAFMRSDRAFHEKVASAAGNAILQDTLDALHARITRIWHLRPWKTENLQRTQADHTAIFRAIAARNPQAAADAMRHHIETLRQDIVDATLETGESQAA